MRAQKAPICRCHGGRSMSIDSSNASVQDIFCCANVQTYNSDMQPCEQQSNRTYVLKHHISICRNMTTSQSMYFMRPLGGDLCTKHVCAHSACPQRFQCACMVACLLSLTPSSGCNIMMVKSWQHLLLLAPLKRVYFHGTGAQ